MNRNMLTATFLTVVLLLAASFANAEVPQMINYQGRLTDEVGIPLTDGPYLIKFTIWDDPVASEPSNELWNSGFQTVQLTEGLFSVQLGQSPMPALPYTVFGGNMVCFLGITVGVETEFSPRTQLLSVPYAVYAHEAETVNRSRDLYHQIIDAVPNAVIKVPFITHSDLSNVKLYLYGNEFQGALAEHTHTGNNAHTHTIDGTVASASVSHTHSFSGTVASGGVSHNHTASSGNTNVSHTHGGSVGYNDPWHTHYGETASSTAHRHDLIVDGYPGTGLYLRDVDGPDAFTASNTADRTLEGSIELGGAHIHGFNTDIAHINHNHSLTINQWTGGSHSHTISVNNTTASHTHTYSGTTGSNNITHSHSFTGAISSFGDGLESTGISAAILPANVRVYVDGSPVAGPFDGAFSSGAIDLSAFVTGAAEHLLEIREEGGNGGRITYNLFVE